MKLTSDPDRDELLEFCNQFRDSLSDGCSDNEWLCSVEPAIRYFAEHYHCGQNSNLYTVLCQSPYTPGMIENFDSWAENEIIGRWLYDEMHKAFASNFYPEAY